MKLKGSCHCQAVHFSVDSSTPYPYMHCYCSICRKTAGGGGYAINIMGKVDSLKVTGKEFLSIYQAIMSRDARGNPAEISEGQRHFCKQCGSCLWIFDPRWSEWIYPFASAIDTPLPKSPEKTHILLDYAANWCEVPQSKEDHCFAQFPEESIEEWHKRHHLYGNI
ncbi:GFA family protein [Legionella sp.]|uniref:GFA family protein n=1 Tax=Legionella sp. TaxID=459 RepID=UPI00321F8416